jgi:hypothetical protein
MNRFVSSTLQRLNATTRVGFHSSAFVEGRPWKRRNAIPVFHASQRPAETADVDFKALGLKYEMTHDPTVVVVKHYWCPKPETLPNLPFVVERTDIGAALPVYTEYKGGKTKVLTILRKIKGDIAELKAEVEKVVGKEVILRPGKIVVEGNYHRRLKVWLTGLGF